MQFLVKVVQSDGSVLPVTLEAADEGEASAAARCQGYAVVGISKAAAWRLSHFRRGPTFSILLFSQELLSLLEAGLSLMEALQALRVRARKQRHEGIIEGLLRALSHGQTFSSAVSQFPQHFPQLYVASLRASERTGDLREALRRFVIYQRQVEHARKTLFSAATYPALVLAVGALVIGFLFFYVVPRFSVVYEGYSGELGLFAKTLLATGRAVGKHSTVVAAFWVGLIALIAMAIASARVRLRVFSAICAIPLVARNVRLYELSRLYRTVGMLLKGGISITRSLQMAAPVLGEQRRDNLLHAERLVSEGRSIASALEEASLATEVATRMLVVGERTGDMGGMMERAAEFHEEELARWLQGFSKLFEPILMLAIGLVVGAIVVLMYMPIFELATAIQ